MENKTFFNWSGGKDSSIALYKLIHQTDVRVARLLTTGNESTKRVTMHGVRMELIQAQAHSIGLPLQKVLLPAEPSMEEYNQKMYATFTEHKKEGFTHGAYGDIFLEDLKKYREQQLARVQITPLFPIWQQDTSALIHEFIDLGFKAIIICIDRSKLDESFAGRLIDRDFLKDLPKGIDPCGENGEFHSFVFDGPIFHQPIHFKKGENQIRYYKTPNSDTDRMGFLFTEIKPNV